MKTQMEICKAFDGAVQQLAAHGIQVQSNDTFHLVVRGLSIHETESVDGLVSFASALSYRTEQ